MEELWVTVNMLGTRADRQPVKSSGRHAIEEELGILCRQVIQLDPSHVNAHYHLGIALNDKGDLDGAIDEYHQAI